ncbi:MAG: hypothetical protein NTZ64_15660 [Polaromonas sp.]|nr:hypothetical protein [Polaromonas sp.]
MTLTKKLLKAVMWLGLASAGLLIVAYLVLIGVNWRDQPPSQAALRLMKLSASQSARQLTVADQDNAYVYLMGFSADPAQEPQALGAKRIAWFQAQFEKSPDDFAGDLPDKGRDFKPQRSAELQALLKTCKSVDAPCLKALENGDKTLAAWLASEPLLLARYKALLNRPAYVHRLPFNIYTPLPPYAQVHEGQKLLLTQAWQLAAQGDAAGVKQLLAQDIEFWRQNLAASDSLIAKMNAANALQRHFMWGNAVLRRLPPALMTQGLPQQWRAPMSDAERAMLPSLTSEWQVSNSIFQHAKEGGSTALPEMDGTLNNRLFTSMFKSLLQPQDSSNKFAERLTASDAALQVPYAQYPAAVERAQSLWDIRAEESEFLFFARRLYNPVGEFFLTFASWDPIWYAVRLSDLEGLRRMAVLTTELRSQGVATGQLAQKLAEAPARNPYTGQPFVWDASAKTVVFTGLQKGERGRHALFY